MSFIGNRLVVFAKGKKGKNVKFKDTKKYSFAPPKGKGECQDLIDLGLKTVGGIIGGKVISPKVGMLARFTKHKTEFTLSIFRTKKNEENTELLGLDFPMERPNHVGIIGKVGSTKNQLWVWEQNVTKDKKTVYQPVHYGENDTPVNKRFTPTESISLVEKFVESEMKNHLTARHRGEITKKDWKVIELWMKQGYGLLVQIKLVSTGKVEFYKVVKD